MYLSSAAAVFVYTHLDVLDGKQARRTGSSSPLGQLFDHGCDALALHLVIFVTSCSLGVGCGTGAVISAFCMNLTWVLGHWEEYHSGCMLYGNGWFGIMEANYSNCLIHLLAAAYGNAFWGANVLAALHQYGPSGAAAGLEGVLQAHLSAPLWSRLQQASVAQALIAFQVSVCLWQAYGQVRANHLQA